MPKQDLYMGLGSLLYALAKTDGRLQAEESKFINEVLCQDLNGEMALYAFGLREAYDSSPEIAYGFAIRRFRENKKDFDGETKKKFMAILQQVALAYDGSPARRKTY
ncbi:TerB family tellurite resistance protein [Rhodocytophaga aerolata]|uniref:TerB family tellurite resistance protein n=1 Tax=Rhodocytophaga aerolata TaxID=455078 RepID=A0ABT8RFB2_9BACT|nr:TerB family tellurite resistance protein [Rhodocytophaga aerolata]MDO1449873.1 TerB family tellurite resistance protein [Rhodocytophaga aerolata]